MIWAFLVKAILGSLIGNAFYEWFKDTRIGIWFNKKIDRYMSWATKKLEPLMKDHKEFLERKNTKKLDRIDLLEKRIEVLERKLPEEES
jgi:hypothetical protein